MTDCEKAEQFVCISCVEEVRYSFVSHLSEALHRKGINDVVVDVDSDNPLSKESQEKIKKARVSVMVLPGDSEPTRVCLDNFVMIRDCHRNKDQVLVPVLYGDIPLKEEWFSALDLGGFSPIHQSRKECSDSKLVEEIVRDVYEKLFYMERFGIYSKLMEIEKMVSKQPLGIRRVGIWGMPGIGKTTLAKAVFDQISGDFDACCFIEDYDKSIHEKGLYRLLEEQFLKEMPGTGTTFTKLSLLKDKLNSKRVLVVLDDVRNALVAESFLEGFEWWGPKSLIIITSRDKQVFSLCRINQVYEVQGLNEKDALQLFLLCASIKDIDEQILHELSMEVIKYADGNPLALSIYGRELKGQRGPSEMMTAFLKLKQCPPFEIVDAIKGSYDTLSNSEKNIFLDIACFFKGENVDYAMQLFEGCGFFPLVGIDVLVEKCLVIISENRVRMHNLIQEFGREIINGETAQIEWRSRLWEPWRIKFLLEDDGQKANGEHITTFKRGQAPEDIEGMFLDTSNLSFDLKPTVFLNMLNLRLLKIYCSRSEIHHVINFSKGFLHSLPNALRLLHWENYPLQSLPQNFDPLHLVEINMPYSQLQKLWGGTKTLEMLRTIRLCHSQKLVDVDDLLNAQNLEVIDLQGCTRLQSFPATGQLLHLRVVNLSGCTEIKILPEIPPNIEMLHLQGTGIIELPLSIVKPKYRELLNLLAEIPGVSGVSNLEQSDLKSLTSLMKMNSSNQDLGKLICLDLKDCSRLRSLPNMVSLELLRVLDLSGCSELETIQGFPRNLKELYIAGTAVREVPQLPQSLELFNAHGCASLKSIRLDFEKLHVHYTFSNCFDLSPQVVNDFLMKALANAKHIPIERKQEFNKAPAFSFCVPSHANQNSTLDLQPGFSVMTRLNPSWRNTLVGFAMLVEVAFSEDYYDVTGLEINCVCRWKIKEGHSQRIERNFHCWNPEKTDPKVQKDHMFVFCDVKMCPTTSKGNDPDIWADLVVFEFFPLDRQKNRRLDDICKVKRCGIYAIDIETCNTSLEMSSPLEVSSEKVKEVLRVSYDGLLEMNKVLFLYIACLFNDDDVDLVAPLIASSIDMDFNSGLKVLADRSLIHISSNGKIGMHCLLRRMGKEILHTESMLHGSSKKIERLVDNSQSYMLAESKNSKLWTSVPRNNTSSTSFFAAAPAPTDSSIVYPPATDVLALQLLSNSLESVFDSPESFYSDAKLVLSDSREVSFHRCVLSTRSSFFKNALAAVAEKEKNSNNTAVKLELKKIAKDYEVGFDSVVTVLAYVYSSRVRPPPKGVSECADENCCHEACWPAVGFMLEVLYLAFVFKIPELVTLYQRHLLDLVDKAVIEDTLVILKLANICGEACKKLLDRCRDIIVKSDVDIVNLDKSLPERIVKQIIEIRKEFGLEAPEVERHVSNILKALDSDDVQLVKLLLTKGHTNLDDAYALHFAVAYCDVKTATDLLDLELADVNHRNPRGYTVLHVAAMRKEPQLILSLLSKGANASQTSLEGRTALLIAKQVTMAVEYNNVPEQCKHSLKGRLCVEMLEHAEKLDPIPRDVPPSLELDADELKMKLLYLEKRVAFARLLFPMEAQVAMEIAQMKGTCEFIGSSLEPEGLTGAKRTSLDLKIEPFKILEKHKSRLIALSKTVELGKRFFPRWSAVLDDILDSDDLAQMAFGEENRLQKRQRYMELRETFNKAFNDDKDESGISSLTASSSSTSNSVAGKRSNRKLSHRRGSWGHF